jgi:deoxyribose-phosphate aldolase
MSDAGRRHRRRVIRRDGGALIEEARAIVEAWSAAPHDPRAGVPPWLADSSDAPGLGRFIEHTLLQPEAPREAVLGLCDEARRYGLRGVCVNGGWVGDCVARLHGSGIVVATVIGFPLGAGATKAKAAEAKLAAGSGAGELDMMMAIGQAKSGEWRYVEDDIRRVVDAAGAAPVKVIVETAALQPVEIAAACLVARASGAALVKSSTGFHPAGGATEGSVALLRRAVGSELGVKASGGIQTLESALRMLAAGADRIGMPSVATLAAVLGPSAPPLGELFGAGISHLGGSGPLPEGSRY